MSSLHRTILPTLLALAPGSFGGLEAPRATLLERARAALGPWPGKDVQLEGRGQARAGGLDGSVRVRLGAQGRYRIDLESALAQSTAFDGEVTWTRDRMGLERRIELEDADGANLFGWVLAGFWTEASALTVSEPPLADGEAPRLALAVAGTPMTMTLTLDAKTLLPTTLTYVDDSGEVRWSFEGWREVRGHKLPHRWSFDDGSHVDTYALESFETRAADDATFHATFAPPVDVHFDPEAEPELEVVRVASGHLLVEPWIEGESKGMFIFDSGAGAMTIDPKVADELGLPKLGEVLAVGVGGKTTASFRRGTRFELGGLVIDAPLYVELDLSFLEPIFGHKVAGIVGYDVLARCVAEVETRTPYLALHDPARYTLSGSSWQDLSVKDNVPIVQARFEGEREGLFRLDTGAGGTLTFHTPAVQALKLLDGRKVTTGAGGGVGGSAEMKYGALEWFELGGHRFERTVVSFSLADEGAFTDRYTLGNIGQQFLAPFRIVLDYPHDRIAFVKLAQ